MTPMRTTEMLRIARVLAVALALMIAGALGGSCHGLPGADGGRTGNARFAEDWPARARGFAEVTRDWTRTGRVVADYDRVLDVSATFLAPEWRAAYVAWRARREGLPDDTVATLTDAERTRAGEHYEVEILVATYRHEENDLHRGDKSLWRVALITADGQQLQPTAIERDRRPREQIRAYFPDLGEFHTAYVARFARDADLLASPRFALAISSPRGRVELVWQAR
jgi:hypothetical protein